MARTRPQTIAWRARWFGPPLIAGADRLGDEDGGADVDGGEDRNDEEDELEPRADAGDRRGAQPRHHERVDGADRGLQQVLADDRRRQAEDAALGHWFWGGLVWLWGELLQEMRRVPGLGGLDHFVERRFHRAPRPQAAPPGRVAGYPTVWGANTKPA